MKDNNNRSTLTIIAQVISVIFHPLLITIYGLLILFTYTSIGIYYHGQISRFLIPLIIFSCLVPIIGMLILKWGGYITNWSLARKEERNFPFFIVFFSYSCQFYYFYQSMIPQWVLAVLLIPLILIVLCFLFNLFLKICLHTVSMGALLGISMSISYNVTQLNTFVLFIVILICSGLVGTSRLLLKKDSSYEVYLGFLLGYCISYLTILFSVIFYIIFKS